MPSNTRRQLEDWLRTIDVPAGAQVLDIGGAQKPVQGRTRTWEAEPASILDLPEPHEGGEVNIKLDIQHSGHPDFANIFDIAFCLEVSEYWYDPLSALRNIADLLKTGGILYISFHFIYPIHNPASEDCLRYTFAGACRLLGEAGFEVVSFQERIASDERPLVEFYNNEGMKPAAIAPIHTVGSLIKAKKV